MRRPFLCQPKNVELLRSVLKEVKNKHPFIIDAMVVLPDHLHCLWTLPKGDSDYSKRWRLIKSAFSRRCEARYKGMVTLSRKNKKEQAVWQRRFWEHTITDEKDFKQHVEYIHYNPVKHGLISAPCEWPFTSFHRYDASGVYDQNWGAAEKPIFGDKIGYE